MTKIDRLRKGLGPVRRAERKDLLDIEISELAVAPCELCHEEGMVVPIESFLFDGTRAARFSCGVCGQSWGEVLGMNAFWREED